MQVWKGWKGMGIEKNSTFQHVVYFQRGLKLGLSRILRKVGQKKRIAGKKNKWNKAKQAWPYIPVAMVKRLSAHPKQATFTGLPKLILQFSIVRVF